MEGLKRSSIGYWCGAESSRFCGNTIRTFESDASAHPGDRIDDEAYAWHRWNVKAAGRRILYAIAFYASAGSKGNEAYSEKGGGGHIGTHAVRCCCADSGRLALWLDLPPASAIPSDSWPEGWKTSRSSSGARG
jgi:hypothetical protein